MCEGINITEALVYAGNHLIENGHDRVDDINVATLMIDASVRIDMLCERIAELEAELERRPPRLTRQTIVVEHVRVGDLQAGDVIKSGAERWKLRETPRRVGNGRVALEVDTNRRRPSIRATRKSFRQETVFLVERIQQS